MLLLPVELIKKVIRSIDRINYDYYYATIEASFDKEGNIFYEEGSPVGREISEYEWEKRAEAFYSDGEWYSQLATEDEGVLFMAYRVAIGYWSLNYVCIDSSSQWNYINSPGASCDFEVSGAREVGGFKDGIGNTRKIYRLGDEDKEAGQYFIIYGGSCKQSGAAYPVASNSWKCSSTQTIIRDASGVVVIKRKHI